MRVLLAIALVISGVAGITAVRAADLGVERSGIYPAGGFQYAERPEMLLVYDNEPGTLVRSYWSEPWRRHHYFPATGRLPKIGRDEHLNVHRVAPRPAKTIYRHWSNAAQLQQAFAHEQSTTLQSSDAQSTPDMQMSRHNLKHRKFHPAR
ncbi:MAG: hypothetical protein ACREB2_00365 [Pseudolabrys sp.]